MASLSKANKPGVVSNYNYKVLFLLSLQSSFHELPPDAYISLRDSLLQHVRNITAATENSIVNQVRSTQDSMRSFFESLYSSVLFMLICVILYSTALSGSSSVSIAVNNVGGSDWPAPSSLWTEPGSLVAAPRNPELYSRRGPFEEAATGRQSKKSNHISTWRRCSYHSSVHQAGEFGVPSLNLNLMKYEVINCLIL